MSTRVIMNCDRCHEDFDPPKIFEKPIWQAGLWRGTGENGEPEYDLCMDLCPGCVESLRQWALLPLSPSCVTCVASRFKGTAWEKNVEA